MRFQILEGVSRYVPGPANREVRTPADAASLIRTIVEGEEREIFVVLLLNTKNRLRGTHMVSVGSLNASLVHPREVFRPAIRHAAAAVILGHNHPSGDASPSPEDIELTRRMAEAGRLLGIEVLDHVIVGGETHVSLREEGAI